MASKIQFYLNGSPINPPKNWQELSIELNYDRDKDTARETISVNEWEFVRENADAIINWINAGMTGGPGIFEGIPFYFEISRAGQIERPFDGYIDLTESAQLSCEGSSVVAKERKNIDWLNDVADSFTFEYLFKETGEIQESDFVFVPYVINSVPDYKEAAIMIISVFVISQEIKAAIQKITELIAEMSNPFEATAIVRAALFIIYLVALVASLVVLVRDLILLIIQPVKYHAAMRTRDLLRIGAAHLGLTFRSSMYEAGGDFFDEVIIPEKFYNPKTPGEDRLFGFVNPDSTQQEGYYKGTFGDLIRAIKTKVRGKVVISGSTMYLIRQDQSTTTPQYQLPPIYQPIYTTNANELKSNYLIQFQVDFSEKNTVQEYLGTSYQVITQPITVINQDLRLMKNLEIAAIPFALAKRKTELTTPEKIVKVFLDVFSVLANGVILAVNGLIQVYNTMVRVINGVIKALGVVGIKINFVLDPIPTIATIDLGASIDNRIDMLKIETDIIGVPKILILSEGSAPKFNKLAPGNEQTLSAKYLWDNYHFVTSFVPRSSMPTGNQVIIKEFDKVPFCFEDYLKVKRNNIIFDSEGNKAEVESLRWNPWEQVAQMKVRIYKQYTNNLREFYIEPDGR